MSKFIGLKRACATLVLVAATAIVLPAQTFTTLYSFDYTDGAYPGAALLQGTDGNLYGTTVDGAKLYGEIFKMTASGTLMRMHSFRVADGYEPLGELIQATDGNFYGTTASGGAYDNCPSAFHGCGTVFKITPSGTLTTLYTFCAQISCTDGVGPEAGLVQATDGNLYGTTSSGGAYDNCAPSLGCGTVFKITPSGTLTTLYSFCSQSACGDGSVPYAGLIQATDGNFYGTTYYGGANVGNGSPGTGTIFKITPNGTLTTLHSFCSQGSCPDGEDPYAGLIQASDGNFYGTAYYGGNNYSGTVFRMTPTGTMTTLHSFCSQSGCADGEWPRAGLVQATDGNFYGTTYYGGASGACPYGCGTVFKITPSGTLTTLHTFDAVDGESPIARIVQDTNGALYGTTQSGGNGDGCNGGCGTVFSLAMGLTPFVETLPSFGPVGRPVKILGTDLTGATSVTFNGVPVVFSVVSPSLIGTTVPAGATTGRVQVITPSGTLNSNLPFRVRP